MNKVGHCNFLNRNIITITNPKNTALLLILIIECNLIFLLGYMCTHTRSLWLLAKKLGWMRGRHILHQLEVLSLFWVYLIQRCKDFIRNTYKEKFTYNLKVNIVYNSQFSYSCEKWFWWKVKKHVLLSNMWSHYSRIKSDTIFLYTFSSNIVMWCVK